MTVPPSPILPGVQVIAHRGASGEAPEHTWPAYERAMALPVDFLEPDLQMTRDGHLVAFHDKTLDRTARGPEGPCRGLVSARSLEELLQCEVGSWFNDAYPDRAHPSFVGQRIVPFENLLERWGSEVRWYPETKHPEASPGMEEALVELLRRFGFGPAAYVQGRVLVQSFSAESLRHLETLEPSLPRIQLLSRDRMAFRSLPSVLRKISEYAWGIGVDRKAVDEGLMETARSAGLQVHVWTVDEPEEMKRLLALGVDGIFTNFPARLLDILGRTSPEA